MLHFLFHFLCFLYVINNSLDSLFDIIYCPFLNTNTSCSLFFHFLTSDLLEDFPDPLNVVFERKITNMFNELLHNIKHSCDIMCSMLACLEHVCITNRFQKGILKDICLSFDGFGLINKCFGNTTSTFDTFLYLEILPRILHHTIKNFDVFPEIFKLFYNVLSNF